MNWIRKTRLPSAVSNTARPDVAPRRALAEQLESRRMLDATTDGFHRVYDGVYNSQFGGGGYIQQIVPTSDPSVFYARGDVFGVYRSADAGETWNALHGNMDNTLGDVSGVRAISVHPTNPNELVIGTGHAWAREGGLWRSTNGGQSWNFELAMSIYGDGGDVARQAGYVIERNPNNPSVIFAGGFGESYRSTDGGRNWSLVSSLNNKLVTDVDWDPAIDNRLWVATSDFSGYANDIFYTFTGGSYRSTNGGGSFSLYNNDAPDEMVFSQTTGQRVIGIFDTDTLRSGWVDGTLNGDIYWDAAPLTGSWVTGNGVGEANASRSNALAAGPNYTLMADADGGVWRLDNGWDWDFSPVNVGSITRGSDWWGPNDQFGDAAASITINPHNTNEWFLTDWFSAWKGTANGSATNVNWVNSVDGIEGIMTHVVVQDPNNANIMYAGSADIGLTRSTDGGKSFTRVETSSDAATMAVVDIAVSRAAGNTVFVIGDDSNNGTHNSGSYISRSTNNGATWNKRAANGLPSDVGTTRHINTIAARPNVANEIYVVVGGTVSSGGGIYKSTNGGNDFVSLNAGLPGSLNFTDSPWRHNRNIAVGKDGSMLTFGSNWNGTDGDDTVYRFEPNDQTWYWAKNFAGPVQEVAAVAIYNDDFFVAAANDGTWKTGNGGTSFSKKDSAHAVSVSVDPNKHQNIVVGTLDGVRRSNNSGGSFYAWNKDLPIRHEVRPTIRYGRIAVAVDGGGTFVSGITPSGNAMQTPPSLFADPAPFADPNPSSQVGPAGLFSDENIA